MSQIFKKLKLAVCRPFHISERQLTAPSIEQLNKVSLYINKLFMKNIKKKKNIEELVKEFSKKFDLCLNDPNSTANSLKMTNTFVKYLATGNEEGNYSAISITRDEIVVMKCYIHKGWIKTIDNSFKLNDFQKKEFSSDMLLAMVAERVLLFAAELNTNLGESAVICYREFFTPLTIDRANLTDRKQEMNSMLTSFLASFGLPIDIKAIVSSAAATFVDSAWFRPLTTGAIEMNDKVMILHLEKSVIVDEWNKGSNVDTGGGPLSLVQTDLSGFGDNGELDEFITPFDVELDKQSQRTGQRRFYKMTSPWNIGELVRLVLISLVEEKVILHGILTDELQKSGSITNKDVSFFESLDASRLQSSAKILVKKLGYSVFETTDILIMKAVCLAVVERACRLIAASIAGLSLRYPSKVLGFTAHGVLYDTHNHIDHNIDRYINECIHESVKTVKVMRSSENGPLRGAALLAARRSTLNRIQQNERI